MKKKVNAEKMLKIHNSSSLSFFVRRMHSFSSPSFLIRQQQQLSSVVFCDMMNIQSERYFSSIPSNKNNKRSNKEKKPMKNQELVDFLRRRNRDKDIDQIEVRVVADIPTMSSSSDEKNDDSNEKSKRPEVSLISLQAAMEKAQDLRLDLFEVHLQQKPPVLRCADYGKFFYNLKKKAKKMAQGTKQKPTKEYKFRAKTDFHDLERKAIRISQYLKKGHPCRVTVTASNYSIRQNDNALFDTLKAVQELIKDDIEQNSVVKQSHEKHATVLFNPKAVS
eukprot:CAMPEP_0178964810 /NCGR_PEP_ID=MMETSP0789-20121207/15900_1 /TAXON_ID=3005 /ORGANISM="Rhizosolenia setigera, Strain CCMP 1694" /LENGTH=277 /DNA_ID=CAMNT_0020649659 /DNA_START=276 /DNA_END=1109 /DNA_ORIENTATION=-